MAASVAFEIPAIDIHPPSDEEDINTRQQRGEGDAQQDDRGLTIFQMVIFGCALVPLAIIAGILIPGYELIQSCIDFLQLLTIVGCAWSLYYVMLLIKELHAGEAVVAPPVEPTEGIPVGLLEERRRRRLRQRSRPYDVPSEEARRRPVARRPVTRNTARHRQARLLSAFRQRDKDVVINIEGF